MTFDKAFDFALWSEEKLQEFVDRLYTSQMERELQRMARKELDKKLRLAKAWRNRE